MLSVSAHTLHAALYRSIYSLLAQSSLGTLQGFLGAFAEFRRATVSFIMSECPSVRRHGKTLLSLDGFSCNLIDEHFSINFREN
jgi:hypothetical protein